MGAYDGNGNFIRSYSWVLDAANSINISASRVDTEDSGFAAGLSLAVTRDGQGKMTADFLPAVDNTLNLGSAIKRWISINGTPLAQFATYPQSPAEATAGVTPTVYSYPSPGIESGDLRRYGGTAPNIPSVVFFDGSTSRALIGQGFSGTNIWFSNGTSTSRLQEFASCFQYNATGGGAYADDTNFGVALYAAAQLTGGSRAIFGLNAVALVSNTAGSGGTAGQLQAAAMAIETDTVNNSNTDANLNSPPYAYTAPDQLLGIRVGSTGNKHPQYAIETFSSTAANRWQAGALLVNWQQFGLQIVQDPTNQPAAGAAVTGPCIQLWASSSGGNPIFQIVNVAGTEVFSITQAGEVINANNVPIQFRDSANSPQNAINVDAANNLRLSCSPTGPGSGYLTDQSGNVRFSWNATGIAFFSGTPVVQPTGYGTPTGNAYQPSFAAGSITLPNLAAAVAQLIIDLKVGKLGLLGA